MRFDNQVLKSKKMEYYELINKWAEQNAKKLDKGPGLNSTKVSEDLLWQISGIYLGAKVENKMDKAQNFYAAYHTPITGDLELLIARTLYHYSQLKGLDWTIYLRKQVTKEVGVLVPDVRIDKDEETIGVIEIKARVGWIQPFFSDEQFKAAKSRFDKRPDRAKDPKLIVTSSQEQLKKYIDGFHLRDSKNQKLFMLVPSLKQVHRKKLEKGNNTDFYAKYKKTYAVNSDLEEESLVVLTKDLHYDAGMVDKKSSKPILADQTKVTQDFENMVRSLTRSSLDLKS
jgi:hypothetical protein